jgi:gas vesicle structural protein
MGTTMTTDTLVRSRPSSGLAEVLDIILDRGLVIDVFVRVSVVGIELLTVDARVVVASVDTYLRFAEAVDRLNLRAQSEAMGIDDMFGGGGGSSAGEGG